MARYLQSRSHSRSCGKLTDVLFRLEECEIRADCPIPGNVLACLDYDRGACPSVPRLLAFTPAHTAATEGIISELEALDPVAAAVTSSNRRPHSWVPNQLLSPNVVEFSKRLDSLLDLLDATNDLVFFGATLARRAPARAFLLGFGCAPVVVAWE